MTVKFLMVEIKGLFTRSDCYSDLYHNKSCMGFNISVFTWRDCKSDTKSYTAQKLLQTNHSHNRTTWTALNWVKCRVQLPKRVKVLQNIRTSSHLKTLFSPTQSNFCILLFPLEAASGHILLLSYPRDFTF